MAAAGELGIEFEPTDVPRLGRYLQMLLEANRTTNLTAITEPAEAEGRAAPEPDAEAQCG